jgi:DNA-binding response OmpR family regulator
MISQTWKLLALTIVIGLCDVTIVVSQDDPPVADDQEASDAAEDQAEKTPPVDVGYKTGDESPLLQEPRTPEQLLDSAVLMVKLARPKLASRYLEKLMELEAGDDALLRLRDLHGPAIFLKLANNPDLHPVSVQLLERLDKLLRERDADPSRLDALIDDLFASPEKHAAALITMRNIGPAVAPRIIRQIADPDRADRYDMLVESLIRIGRPVIPPLVAALNAPENAVRVAAAMALGNIGDRRAAQHLWATAYAPGESPGVQSAFRDALAALQDPQTFVATDASEYGAVMRLNAISKSYLRPPRGAESDESLVSVWSWDDERRTVRRTGVSPAEAALIGGAQMARGALRISPENVDAQALFLASSLALESYHDGWNVPLPSGPGTTYNLALTAGPDVLSRSLKLSMERSNPRAALAVLQVIRQVATQHQLFKNHSPQTPVVAALDYPDRRVQFAAAATVLQLDPVRSFPGVERVVSILSRALNEGGGRRCLVVDADVQRANDTAGLLGEMGYQPQTARTGQTGFKAAVSRMDIELIVLHANTIRWDLSQTIANLRADSRTAEIPIVVYGPDSVRPRVRNLIARTPRTTYVDEVLTIEHLRLQLQPFLESLGSVSLNKEQREQFAAAAVDWLAHIASGRRTNVFDLVPAEASLAQVAVVPELGEKAIFALGAIPSRTVQGRLEEIALNGSLPVELRELGLLQLAFHIQNFGLQLTRKQVAEISALWKSGAEPELATALASVLGTLKPNSVGVGRRLRDFPRPPVRPAIP